MLKTTNGGTSWMTSGIGNCTIVSVDFIGANIGWAVGFTGTIII